MIRFVFQGNQVRQTGLTWFNLVTVHFVAPLVLKKQFGCF